MTKNYGDILTQEREVIPKTLLQIVAMETVKYLASLNAAVIFTRSSCSMCHSVKQLFYEHGASPVIHELDCQANGSELECGLQSIGCNPTVPAVFIGGNYIGSVRDILSLQIDGTLRQMLIEARAIWL